MVKVYAMIANGTEEAECLTVVDLLRRAGIDVILVSVEKTRNVLSSHNVKIEADLSIAETDFSDGDMIFLPGGMPGAERLSSCIELINAMHLMISSGGRLSAICAAPGVVLGRHGFLQGKNAACFPGFEDELHGAKHTAAGVVTDGAITTARGLGFAIDLGLELISLLLDKETAGKVKKQIQYKD